MIVYLTREDFELVSLRILREFPTGVDYDKLKGFVLDLLEKFSDEVLGEEFIVEVEDLGKFTLDSFAAHFYAVLQ